MFEFINDVQADAVPDNFAPSKEAHIYNVRESEDGYVFDVVLAVKGTPVESLQRQAKFQMLSRLKTEHNGMLFDSDSASRANMLVAVGTLPDSEEVVWKLACNTWASCTVGDLRSVLVASQKQIQELIGGEYGSTH